MTVRGREDQARRLHRVASKTAHASNRADRIAWCDLPNESRSAWRAVAEVVWCDPNPAKVLR